MRLHSVFAAAMLLVVGYFPAAEATPIAYKLGGTLTGSFDGQSLFNRSFTWTLTSDTTAWTFSAPFFQAPATSAVIDLDGFGAVTPTLPLFYFSAPGIGLGQFMDASRTQGVWFASSLLEGYMWGLTGPLSVSVHSPATLSTDHGDFVIAFTSFTYFEATEVVASEVPEPAAIALMGFGLLGVGALRRRKA